MPFQVTMLSKRSLLLGKVEADYGTDPVPVKTTDVMLAYDTSITPDIETEKRPNRVASFDALGVATGRQTHDFSFKTVSVGGKIGEPPLEAALLKMCGFVAADTVYALSSEQPAANSSATLYFYIDGVLYKLTGCRGNMILRAVNAKPLELEFKGKGLYLPPAVTAFVSDPTFSCVNPILCTGLSITIGGLALTGIESIELDLATEITVSHSIGATTGVREINRVGRDITLKLNPEVTPAQIVALEEALIGSTQQAIGIGFFNGDYGIQLGLPNCELLSATNGERDGKVIKDLTFAVNNDCATGGVDNAIKLQYEP